MELNRDNGKNKKKLKFTVDIPPSKNHAFFYRRNAKVAKADTRRYQEAVDKLLKEEMKKQGWKKEDEHVWYYMDMFFYFPDKRRRDSHNSLEVLMDSIQESIVADDYYVLPRIQSVKLDRINPRLVCYFYPIDDEEVSEKTYK